MMKYEREYEKEYESYESLVFSVFPWLSGLHRDVPAPSAERRGRGTGAPSGTVEIPRCVSGATEPDGFILLAARGDPEALKS